jgi:hypothetical protein
VSGQLHDPGRFTSKEKALSTHWIGGWVGLDAVVKRKNPHTLSGLEPSIIQPVAQRYTTLLHRHTFSKCGFCSMLSGFLVNMAWRVLGQRIEDALNIWKVSANRPTLKNQCVLS